MECSISATRATHKVWVFVLCWVNSHISACLVFLTQWEIKCWKNLDLTSSCTVIPLYNNGKLQHQRAKYYTQLNNHFSKHMWLHLGCVLRIVLPSLRKRGGKERESVWKRAKERERKAIVGNFWQFCVFVPELRESSRWLHSVWVCRGVWLCLWLCHWCCYPPSQQPTGEVSLFSHPTLWQKDSLCLSEDTNINKYISTKF